MKSEVFNQSTCLVSTVAYQYYVEGKSRAEITEGLGLSSSTVSRLLKKAKEDGIIELHFAEPYLKCHKMGEQLKEMFGLDNVMIVPVIEKETKENSEIIKKQVALEGARYVQRIITDGDVLGLAWGGTMYHMIQYLNPCRKVNASIVTMHGSIAGCNPRLAVNSLVNRAAMAFGGRNVSFSDPGLLKSEEELEKIKNSSEGKEIFSMFDRIDISVSGVGPLYPKFDSLLTKSDFFTEEELEQLKEQGAYADVILRYINKDGEECDTEMKNRTLSISLDSYRHIPCKIIATAGSQRAYSLLALLKGKLVDVLIIDSHAAEAVLNLTKN